MSEFYDNGACHSWKYCLVSRTDGVISFKLSNKEGALQSSVNSVWKSPKNYLKGFITRFRWKIPGFRWKSQKNLRLLQAKEPATVFYENPLIKSLIPLKSTSKPIITAVYTYLQQNHVHVKLFFLSLIEKDLTNLFE